MKYSYNRLILEGFACKGGFMNPTLAGPLVSGLKGQSHELRMLGKLSSQRLFIMAAMMDSSVLWKYFAWNVLDFFSLTFRTRQIELLSLGKITRM